MYDSVQRMNVSPLPGDMTSNCTYRWYICSYPHQSQRYLLLPQTYSVLSSGPSYLSSVVEYFMMNDPIRKFYLIYSIRERRAA